jgi:hypothetical protein
MSSKNNPSKNNPSNPKEKTDVGTTAVVLPSGASVDISNAVVASESKRLAQLQFRTSGHVVAEALRKAQKTAAVASALDRLAVKCDERVIHATVTARYTAMAAEVSILASNPNLQGLATTLAKLRKGPTATKAPSNGTGATLPMAPVASESIAASKPNN